MPGRPAKTTSAGWPLGLASLRQARSLPGHVPAPEGHPELASFAIVDAEEAGSNLVAAAKYFTDPLHGMSEKASELAMEGGKPEGGSEGPGDSASQGGVEGHLPAHGPDQPAAEHGAGTESAGHHGEVHGAGEHHGPMHAFAEEGTPGGVSDLASTLGLGGAMLPLSAMAIHAGYRELREVSEQRKELRDHKEALQQRREVLDSVLDEDPAHPAGRAQSQAIDQAIDDVAYQQHLNRHDGRVAASTLASASLIFAKTAVETSVHAGLAIGAGSASASGLVAHSAAAAGAASAATIAGGYVLGPAASVMASVVGAVFLHQSRAEKKRFRADFSRVSEFLAGVDAQRLGPDAQRYHDFLKTKFDQRKRFVNGFNNWNKGFVAGGVTYTASTAAKVGVGIAAVAGASAAGPVGLALLIGAGLLGAVTMGVGSHQFFLTHGKLKRYRDYERGDAVGIDRAFLSMVDLLQASPVAGERAAAAVQGPELQADGESEFHSARSSFASEASETASVAEPAEPAGFLLRSALYAATDGRERALGGFLQDAATDLRKHYRDKGRSTDEATPATPSRKHSTAREARALVRGGMAYGKSLLTGHKPREARQQARQAYAARTDRLTPTALAQWLDTPASRQAQVDFMRSVADLQVSYLQSKLAAREPLKALEDLLAGADGAAREGSPPMTQADLAAELRKARADDEAQYLQWKSLQASLGGNAASAPGASLVMQSLRQQFLLCETGTAHAHEDTALQFARYCLKDARAKATTVRGTLLATEMQAARVREKAAATPAASAG
ncbi:hypothetical protein Acav_0495 [Paracidovorax avenae ATCC 19860]|uniref:Type III secretion system effector protein XopK n=1 Tax=Paracidovorax avenae (strain ATCC 19860 / DSM 7227 / CCUG 15838 / JCM 20985 / LMG 2117 / NCPPB 1011) TaxID=643561 RepID=F0Q5B9_PARA1|nr:hypothetical protein [Paracidovorax avenae]ADX44418.1 hypothetical protein Acav_0495 [Paracidovorax avenae ATCC 19860]